MEEAKTHVKEATEDWIYPSSSGSTGETSVKAQSPSIPACPIGKITHISHVRPWHSSDVDSPLIFQPLVFNSPRISDSVLDALPSSFSYWISFSSTSFRLGLASPVCFSPLDDTAMELEAHRAAADGSIDDERTIRARLPRKMDARESAIVVIRQD